MSPEAWVTMGQPWQNCQQVQERPGAREPLSSHQSRGRQKRPSCSSEDSTDDSSEGKAPSTSQTQSLS